MRSLSLVNIFIWPSAHFGGVAVGFLAACMPWLVMTGMHHAVTPFMIQAIATSGYDTLFRPAYLLHNMSEGGACIGVGLKTKNKAFRMECFSVAFGCIVAGVSEPAIYGINLQLKRPMYGVMAGGAMGGIVAGFLGATAYVYGYSTLLAIPIFQHTILAIILGILVAIITSAATTMILGFDESNINRIHSTVSNSKTSKNYISVNAPATGEITLLKDINDTMFSQEMLGPGCAIKPHDGNIYAPIDGIVSMLASTKHAIGITCSDGTELLIHIGIDTVNLNGKGFSPLIKQGDSIKRGQLLMTVDLNTIRSNKLDDSIILVVTNSSEHTHIKLSKTGSIGINEQLLTIIRS